jgi:hypothetical protein
MLNTGNRIAVFTAVSLLLSPILSNAEDFTYNNVKKTPETTYYYSNTYSPVAGNDQLYVLPPQYQGKTYPEEQQGAVGYHGTNKSAEANSPNPANYYYYYY